MKRTLLGLGIVSSVTSLGAAGAYTARHFLAPAPSAAVADQEASAPAEMSQQPIPLARDFVPQQPAAVETYAQDTRTEQDAGLRQQRYNSQPAVIEAGGDIPDAEQVPPAEQPQTVARSADPFASRDRQAAPAARYAEQTAAAEIVDESAQEPIADTAEAAAEEPQPLRPASSRYDRTPPASARASSRMREEPAEQEEPAAEAEPPVAESAETVPSAAETVEEPAQRDEPFDGEEGTGRPGDPQLSGSQAPTLTIEKTAPAEIQIGKVAKFSIKVRNAGSVPAAGVEVHDTVPQGTQFLEATPTPERGPQGALVWNLGAMKPGQEQTMELQLMPTAEGEIGSVATVHFKAEASVRTLSTKPMLAIEASGPATAMKGQEVKIKIKLSNPGTGAATGVVLSETVPQGLSHPSGRELEFEVGTLKPGENRELELTLLAAEAGPLTNLISVQGEGNLQGEARVEMEVVAPQLQVNLSGPKRRYLERNATHNISVSNPGTASAKDIELVAVIPKELKFVEANNGGQFDPATHSVYWSLEELPPQETGTVTLTTLPLKTGDAKLLIKTSAQSGLKDQREESLAIEGLAAINFQLSDVNDPIEAGGNTSYEIRVTNQGSKAATNVRLVAVVPREMKPLSAEGPVRYKIEGQRIVFEPLKTLAPKAEQSFSIKVQALEQGDLRLQAQISTDEIREPITKEESTRVYGNE